MNFFGYKNEFSQVILNLISNAKDALIDKRKKNREFKALIDISTKVDGNSFYIFVDDSAGGVDEAIIDRVFEPYFTTKFQDQGTGIGLYMSKMIIDSMRGEISVQNRDVGARFTLKLPKE
jgi:signal transduction histidine kinase